MPLKFLCMLKLNINHCSRKCSAQFQIARAPDPNFSKSDNNLNESDPLDAVGDGSPGYEIISPAVYVLIFPADYNTST